MATRTVDQLGIDLDAVEEALSRDMTFPARWYSDPDIYAFELEAIFTRSWQYAGRSRSSPGPATTSSAAPATSRSSSPGASRASSTGSSTCAGTARSRWRRRMATDRPCSAGITPGRTTSTAACARRRAASASGASTRRTSHCCRYRWRLGTDWCSSTPIPARRRCASVIRVLPTRGGARAGFPELPLPRPLHLRGSGQLEGVGRERERVLPLPDRSQEQLQRRVRG